MDCGYWVLAVASLLPVFSSISLFLRLLFLVFFFHPSISNPSLPSIFLRSFVSLSLSLFLPLHHASIFLHRPFYFFLLYLFFFPSTLSTSFPPSFCLVYSTISPPLPLTSSHRSTLLHHSTPLLCSINSHFSHVPFIPSFIIPSIHSISPGHHHHHPISSIRALI